MSSIDYIAGVADRLAHKYNTRNPYEICDALGVRIRIKDLGTEIKAYYFYCSRIRNIVINSRVSETIRRILVAHELGHDRLHKEIAMLKGFQEIELFDATLTTEYEANILQPSCCLTIRNCSRCLTERKPRFSASQGSCTCLPHCSILSLGYLNIRAIA